MKFRKLIIFMALSLFFISAFLFMGALKNEKRELNIIEVNDLVKTAEENWQGDLKEVIEKADEYKIKVLIMDNLEDIKCRSEGYEITSLNDAVKNRDTIVDIKAEDKIIGKAVFYNDDYNLYEKLKGKNSYIAITCMFIFFIIVLLILMYLNIRIICPFEKLKKFAKSISLGKFDIELKMDKNNVFGAFTESFDIMREELKRAQENERKAAESKKQLVASLSHDIKTPLASIQAINELMSVTVKDEKQKRNIKAIEKKVNQIELLINNLFDSTLEDLKELEVKVSEEESSIFKEIIENADYKNKVKKAEIRDCILKCDVLRMQQVFDNIISNSYKYADTDIKIDSEILEDNLIITIRDFGRGVKEDELPLILQKFYRGSNVEGKSGAGIGLYVSKYFIEKMGGRLEINNMNPGFKVKLYILMA